MKKLFNLTVASVLSFAILFTSVNVVSAAEVEEMSVYEAVDNADEITEENVVDLEDASTIVEEEVAEDVVETETLVDGMHTYTTSTSMANFAGLGYTNDEQGPISIVKATLNGNTEVYVIGLSGTAFVENQATGIVSDILAGFNLSNPYLSATVKAITENVPANSKLIFCGHSLGGMVAQQAAANKTIKKNYEVLNTVTFGAPVISAMFREGNTTRLGDKYDIIPYLSVTGMILPVNAIGGLNREDGGYGNVTNFWSAHMGSYCRTDVWGNYDVLGFKYGQNTLTYDVSTVSYYKAPTAW